MTTLPAVRDAAEAEALVRELFRNPPAAARALATASDTAPSDAVFRFLTVALNDLPSDQGAVLCAGIGGLLSDVALAGYAVCLLEERGGEAAARAAAEVVVAGTLRGVPVNLGSPVDLHGLVLGLCARLAAPLAVEALARDAADPRYRDLVLLILASSSDPAGLAAALSAVARGLDLADEYALEALGRALRESLTRHGERSTLALLRGQDVAAAPVLLAGLREALTPARSALLSAAQQVRERETLRRRAAEQPSDAYARLRLDDAARAAFLRRAESILEGGQ